MTIPTLFFLSFFLFLFIYLFENERYKSVIFAEFNDMEKTKICLMNSFAMNFK